MKNEQQSQNLLLKVDPRSTFCNNFLQTATNVLLRDKLITQGEKRETSTKTCNGTMLRDKLRVFVSRISPMKCLIVRLHRGNALVNPVNILQGCCKTSRRPKKKMY